MASCNANCKLGWARNVTGSVTVTSIDPANVTLVAMQFLRVPAWFSSSATGSVLASSCSWSDSRSGRGWSCLASGFRLHLVVDAFLLGYPLCNYKFHPSLDLTWFSDYSFWILQPPAFRHLITSTLECGHLMAIGFCQQHDAHPSHPSFLDPAFV